MKILIVLFVFLAATFYGAYGITCFYCAHGGCTSGADFEQRTCEEKDARCISVIVATSTFFDLKTCTTKSIESTCKPLLKIPGSSCYTCDTDLCNFGNTANSTTS